MLRVVFTVGLTVFATVNPAAAQQSQTAETVLSAEAEAWNAVKDSTASADIFAFIEQYPNGEFVTEARARMIDLLWVEMATEDAADSPEVEAEPVAIPVTFSAPLELGDPGVVGKTLEELIKGTPLFPPVEGLPEEYWKTQDCSNCHEWEQVNLCAQATTYLSDAGSENLTKRHPYGGSFKMNLRTWAEGGCE